MNKSRHFSGQTILRQILRLIPMGMVSDTARYHCGDRYYKKFKTYDCLVSMLYTTLSGVSSLHELSKVLLAFEDCIGI